MQRGKKFLIAYFLIFGALTAIAIIPGGTLMVLIITGMALPLFGMPGFLVAASPTILLYSASLLPLWRAFGAPRYKLALVAAAALVPAAVAIAPGLISLLSANAYGLRKSEHDFSHPAQPGPRTIELIGDGHSGVFVYGQEIGNKYASCNDLCLRLLFNGEAKWVRMTRLPDLYLNRRSGTTRSVTYRVERRVSCPNAYPEGTKVDKTLRDRLVSGDCLIATAGSDDMPAATVTYITIYSRHQYPPKPPSDAPRRAAIIESVKELNVAQLRDGALTPILRQTETTAKTLTVPFYFGFEMHMQGGYNGATVGSHTTVVKPVDLAQVLRETFGFKLDPIEPPRGENLALLAAHILSLPAEALSALEQEVVYEALKPMIAQSSLSDGDLDLLGRVVRDRRIASRQIGVSLKSLFRKHAAQMSPLIPTVIERLAAPVPERGALYPGTLGQALMVYPADALQPHREMIISIVEAQADFASTGLLARVAELKVDSSDLIARRLESPSNIVRKAAAIAACRATPENWEKLEPIVLEHLRTSQQQPRQLRHENSTLLLALVRFGKRDAAESVVRETKASNGDWFLRQYESKQEGFAPTECR